MQRRPRGRLELTWMGKDSALKRTGRGYRSHDNYKCRIMLYNAARMAA